MIERIRAWLWLGVGVVALAYLLMGIAKMLLPAIIVVAVLIGLYSMFFKRRW